MGMIEFLKLAKRNFNSDIKFIKAKKIQNVSDCEDPYFWSHHGFCKESWLEFAAKSKILYDKWLEGKSAKDIINDPECNDVSGAYLSDKQIITIEKDKNGLHYSGDGRHRIMSAKILNLYIPVIIKKGT